MKKVFKHVFLFELNGDKFFVRKDGIMYATSMMIALVIVEMTDLIFALDSIPAILAITSDSFIVITSEYICNFGFTKFVFSACRYDEQVLLFKVRSYCNITFCWCEDESNRIYLISHTLYS